MWCCGYYERMVMCYARDGVGKSGGNVVCKWYLYDWGSIMSCYYSFYLLSVSLIV